MTRDLILDCQYGSTGKGLFAGALALVREPDTIAYAPSPNAGHTLWWGGTKFVHKMLPSGITSPSLRQIILGPGSLINLDQLLYELKFLDEHVPSFRGVDLFVHENAAVVYPRHRDEESQGGTAPGSTRQGVGAAQRERIWRKSGGNIVRYADHQVFKQCCVINTQQMQEIYNSSQQLLIESCQGYSLSMYHGDYPHVTSRDVTTASILSDTGVPWPRSLRVHGTFRTYPIRVANRPASGENSGPCYPDSEEIDFCDIGQPQELTTVTQLPRRIFTWSQQQAIEACAQNRVDYAFLNFAQYCTSFAELYDRWLRLNECTEVTHMGFGPALDDVFKVGAPELDKERVRKIYERYRASTAHSRVDRPAEPEQNAA